MARQRKEQEEDLEEARKEQRRKMEEEEGNDTAAAAAEENIEMVPLQTGGFLPLPPAAGMVGRPLPAKPDTKAD